MHAALAKSGHEQCLLTSNGTELPELRDYMGDDNNHRITRHYQAIVSTYKFTCCGKITEWGADVFFNISDGYTIDFQVWRPTTTVNNSSNGTGCYSLVGNNRFSSISLNNGLVKVAPTPSYHKFIYFSPSDVLGFYIVEVPETHSSNGIVLQTIATFKNDIVWYGSTSVSEWKTNSMNGDCLISVGSEGVLNKMTRAAPVISIGTCMFFILYCIMHNHIKLANFAIYNNNNNYYYYYTV